MILDRIPAVPDVQSAWLILLHCTQARANCLLRVVRPDAARAFAQNHDEGLFQRPLQDPSDRHDAMCPGGAGNSHTLIDAWRIGSAKR